MVTTGGRGHQVGLGVDGALQAHLHVGFRDAARAVAEFLHHQFGGVGIQRLRDGRHDAELHQRLDHLAGAGGHAVGEFLHRDRVRQNDVAHDLHLIGAQPLQFCLTAFAFALAAHRGQRADAFVLALDRRLHVDAAGAAAGRRCPSWPRRSAACAAARCRRGGGSAAPRPPPPSPRAGAEAQRLGRRRRRGGRRGRGLDDGAARRRRARRRGRGSEPSAVASAALRGCLLGFLPRRVLGRLAGLLFGGLARLFLAPARLLGGRQDRDLLLLAPFRLALARLALLLDQRALPRRLLGRRQRARDRGDRRPLAGCGAGARGRRRRRRRRRQCRPPARPALPTVARFLRTSTCTTLERPWLKLCRTDPASTVRPSSRRPAGRSESRPLPVS